MESAAVRDDLVCAHLWRCELLAHRVWRKIGYSIPLGDLIQYGSIGLIKAASKFEPSRGLKFQTYAGHKILGAIIDGIRKETGRGLNRPDPRQILHISAGSADKDEDVEELELLLAQDFRGYVEAVIEIEKGQKPRDLKVLRMIEIEGHTGKEVATLLNISDSRVSELKQRAIRRISGVPAPKRKPRKKLGKALAKAA